MSRPAPDPGQTRALIQMYRVATDAECRPPQPHTHTNTSMYCMYNAAQRVSSSTPGKLRPAKAGVVLVLVLVVVVVVVVVLRTLALLCRCQCLCLPVQLDPSEHDRLLPLVRSELIVGISIIVGGVTIIGLGLIQWKRRVRYEGRGEGRKKGSGFGQTVLNTSHSLYIGGSGLFGVLDGWLGRGAAEAPHQCM